MAAPAWAWPSAANCPICLGGEIQLRSTPGVGSTFKLLPAGALCRRGYYRVRPANAVGGAGAARTRVPVEQIADDRANLAPGDMVLLVVEDDPHYARILMDLAHEEGFKVMIASRGEEALDLAEEYSRSPSRSIFSCPTCWAGR